MAKLSIEEIIAAVKELTVIELNDLVKAIEEEFGVSAAAAVVAGPAAGAGDAAPAAEEKSEFDVILNNAGAKKIEVIKVVREITGLGLMEAKNMVDKTPSKVKEAVSKEAATEIVEKLKAAGAEVEMK